MNLNEIKKNINQLPIPERASLARWIILNLEETSEAEDVDKAWRIEVRKRVDEIKSGKVKMISSEDVWKDLLSGYDK